MSSKNQAVISHRHGGLVVIRPYRSVQRVETGHALSLRFIHLISQSTAGKRYLTLS